MEPNSKKDAQWLWQKERQIMQDTLRQQKEDMMEDKKWLEKEEKLLVGTRAAEHDTPASFIMNVPLITQRGSGICKVNLPFFCRTPWQQRTLFQW